MENYTASPTREVLPASPLLPSYPCAASCLPRSHTASQRASKPFFRNLLNPRAKALLRPEDEGRRWGGNNARLLPRRRSSAEQQEALAADQETFC